MSDMRSADIALCEHFELWPEMGRAGRRFVKEHYDIKKLNRRLVEIYEALLAEGPKQFGMSSLFSILVFDGTRGEKRWARPKTQR